MKLTVRDCEIILASLGIVTGGFFILEQWRAFSRRRRDRWDRRAVRNRAWREKGVDEP